MLMPAYCSAYSRQAMSTADEVKAALEALPGMQGASPEGVDVVLAASPGAQARCCVQAKLPALKKEGFALCVMRYACEDHPPRVVT